MRMVFTRVDPYDTDRMFSFTLGVNEHNEFERACCKSARAQPPPRCASRSDLTSFVVVVAPAAAVVECVPTLTGVDELCANLRATSNLTRFTVGMRKKFKEFALSEEHK